MRVVNVQPKEVHVTLELSLKELNHVLNFLSKSKVEFDGEEEPEFQHDVTFVQDVFFPLLDGLTEEVKNGLGSNSPGS